MNDYLVKVIHPEWGQQGDHVAQGANAFEALENAVGSGSAGSIDAPLLAYVRNVQTGFTVKIEFAHT